MPALNVWAPMRSCGDANEHLDRGEGPSIVIGAIRQEQGLSCFSRQYIF